jgi:hypothetical protein
MNRRTRFALVVLWMSFAFGPTIAQAGSSQSKPEEALGAVQRFSGCLRELTDTAERPRRGLTSPNDKEVSELGRMRLNKDRIVNGLVTAWGKMPQEQALARMPPEYLEHLIAITAICEGTLTQVRTSSKSVTAVALAFAHDLELKVEDCQKFDMGRMIPVEIRVTKDGVLDNGWSIFYKWLPGSVATTVVELPFPAPTPGAVRALPAGLYVMRGVKSTNGKTVRTDPSTVPVGGTDKVTFSISAP